MSNDRYIGTGKFDPGDLPQALESLLTDFTNASFETRQQAVQKGAEVFQSAVEQATPRSPGSGTHMADCWEIKTKYTDRRYVGNTKVTDSGIPLSNILEYSERSPHCGFIRRCFESSEAQIYEAVKQTIQNGGKT